MRRDNTKFQPARTLVWAGEHEGLIMAECPDGSVNLIRSSDLDDGPSRTIVIRPEALMPLAARLWALVVSRDNRGFGQAMARASIEIAERAR